MKVINEYIRVSDDAVYVMVTEKYCRLTKGWAESYAGGWVEALLGGRGVARSGGVAVPYSGGTAEARSGGRICKRYPIADDGKYKLFVTDEGYYFAGCRVIINKEHALKHWDRVDDRALLFTFAILMCSEKTE